MKQTGGTSWVPSAKNGRVIAPAGAPHGESTYSGQFGGVNRNSRERRLIWFRDIHGGDKYEGRNKEGERERERKK